MERHVIYLVEKKKREVKRREEKIVEKKIKEQIKEEKKEERKYSYFPYMFFRINCAHTQIDREADRQK